MDELEKLNGLDEISEYIDTKQKEAQSAISAREVIEAERYNLQLKILELQRDSKDYQIKKNALDQSLNKARAVCMRLALEIKRASSRYWNIKHT